MNPKLKGHVPTYRHNGETDREESAWTVTCSCGRFEESCRLKVAVVKEFRLHRGRVQRGGLI